jgi:hypothetical protein
MGRSRLFTGRTSRGWKRDGGGRLPRQGPAGRAARPGTRRWKIFADGRAVVLPKVAGYVGGMDAADSRQLSQRWRFRKAPIQALFHPSQPYGGLDILRDVF